MAFASRCEIQGRASLRRLLSACSKLSTPRNQAVWDLGCRSAGRLLKRITDDYGRALTCHVALFSASLYLLIRPPHREWSVASDPQCGRHQVQQAARATVVVIPNASQLLISDRAVPGCTSSRKTPDFGDARPFPTLPTTSAVKRNADMVGHGLI